VHPDDRVRVSKECRAAFPKKVDFSQQYRLLLPDGTTKHVCVIWHSVQDQTGKLVEYLGTLADVTKQELLSHELKQREAYLAEAQRLSHTGSFGWKPATDEHFWSDETFRIWEYDASTKITLQLILDRIHPEDIPRAQQVIARAVENGQDFELEYRLLLPGGSVKHIHVVTHVFGGNSGNYEFVGAVMDVTEQKNTQEALNAAKARFEGILEIAEDAIISMDSSQRIVLFNQGAETVFGYASNEVMGQPLDILLPQRFAHSHRGHIEAFAKSPEVSRSMGQRREVFGRRKDGSEFPAEASISKLALGSEVVFTVILRDITERKRAEEALRRSEAYLAEAQKLTHTGSWARNPATGEILYFSEEMFRVMGFDPQQGLPTEEMIRQRLHPDDIEQVLRAFQKGVRQKTDYRTDFRILLPDGPTKHIHTVGHIVVSETGEIVAWYGTAMDVTERKHAEESLRRSEAFLAEGQRISHTGSWTWNAATGEMTWSQERFRIFGIDPEKNAPSMELFLERVHPEDRARIKQAFDSSIRKKEDFEREYRIVTPDWVIKHIHSVGHAVINESGELVEFIGTTMDITERKRAEERAKNQQEAIRLALNAFVEELDVYRFLGHVIVGLTSQFQAASAELWLFAEATDSPSLRLACQQGKVIRPNAQATEGFPSGGPHAPLRSAVGRTPRIIEIPADAAAIGPNYGSMLKEQGVKTLMVIPLVLGEQCLGFFELRFQVATPFTPDELDLAQALVHHATLAVQLSCLAQRTEHMAVTEERNRLARDIHDTLAQAFAGIVLHGEALGTSLGVSKARSEKALASIQKLARSGLNEARRSVQALRPMALEGSTLPHALQQAAERLSEDGKLSCEFKQRGKAVKLSAEVQNELFRIAQEAMTNVCKHAQARSAWITLEFQADQVILMVSDDGVGLAATESPERKRGYGLGTMRERAQRIGARLEIESPADGGTTIRVVVASVEDANATIQNP
jgi:PAS domain S-box-containing protein